MSLLRRGVSWPILTNSSSIPITCQVGQVPHCSHPAPPISLKYRQHCFIVVSVLLICSVLFNHSSWFPQWEELSINSNSLMFLTPAVPGVFTTPFLWYKECFSYPVSVRPDPNPSASVSHTSPISAPALPPGQTFWLPDLHFHPRLPLLLFSLLCLWVPWYRGFLLCHH